MHFVGKMLLFKDLPQVGLIFTVYGTTTSRQVSLLSKLTEEQGKVFLFLFKEAAGYDIKQMILVVLMEDFIKSM